MSGFDQIITSLAILGLAISAVISYLKVNKLWARKHIKEVAESVSVAAALLSLLTTVPFLVKFVVIDRDYVAAGKFLLSLLVFVAFFLVGIGLWVRKEERTGFWQMIVKALLTERRELTYLLHAIAQPREARAILRVLQLVSTVDREFDERERRLLQSVAEPWGIHASELLAGAPEHNATLQEVRDAFSAYLALKPPTHQASHAYDLVRFMVRADRRVSSEESLILDELGHLVQRYVGMASEGSYEVLVVPQTRAQRENIRNVLSDAELLPRAGGEAYVAGSYYSEAFGREICRHYREQGYFCTIERSP